MRPTLSLSIRKQFAILLSGIVAVVFATLAMAVLWGPKTECALQFPKIVGCAIASYEGLSGGLIAAAGALVAGWLAYSAAREQIAWDRSQAAAFELKNLKGILSGEEFELARLKIAQGNMRAFGQRLSLQAGAVASPCVRSLNGVGNSGYKRRETERRLEAQRGSGNEKR